MGEEQKDKYVEIKNDTSKIKTWTYTKTIRTAATGLFLTAASVVYLGIHNEGANKPGKDFFDDTRNRVATTVAIIGGLMYVGGIYRIGSRIEDKVLKDIDEEILTESSIDKLIKR